MCLTCPCDEPNNRHGKPSNLIASDFQKSVAASEVTPEQALANLNKKLKAKLTESPRAQVLGLAEGLLLKEESPLGDEIRKLIGEGRSQAQSVAIALDMQRRGLL